MSSTYKIRLAGIIRESIVDGPGLRYVIFTQGCLHNCPRCHNKKTHDINGGYLKEGREIIEELKELNHIDGITISGGEPFLQEKEISLLIEDINKENKLLNRKINIIIYTGYTKETLEEMKNEYVDNILNSVDVIIDGPYEEEKKTYDMPFIGSKNQRIIPLTKSGRSLMNGYIV